MSGETVDGVVTAAVLVIGDEILSGRTKDVNIGFIAEYCTAIGIDLREARIVPDVEAEIVAAVNGLRARYDHVFTTGGIGPTHDDITADCVARAFGVPLLLDPRAVALLEAHYPPGGLNEARLRMARIPEGATLIENAVSAAPGFTIGNVHVMAGVPKIMQAMFDVVTGRIPTGRKMLSRTVHAPVGESRIAAGLAAIQADFPDLSLGSYPKMADGRFSTDLVIRGRDAARLDAAEAAVAAMVAAVVGAAS
ncbi:competence/damage-inducible protein A [Prosthecomicrobium pneumaticum]|uniref:Molybdenum cofactor synthesis domain-containing protein n=1 Tax=Prosthecomicrobium pneumaticum TaxID=81895 RepID=A0A7W9FPM7_9HYPH|nr:molybdopterin-binding protein [Prosthecomicrobium pneumaticum]MBB5754470.1 molybdenum cofactor synthesis domain-containing protein [Prosthecomicrobium pneumaticum]